MYYSSQIMLTYANRRRSALTSLVTTMVAQEQSSALLKLPFATLAAEVDEVLAKLCKKTLNITTGPPYHKLLYTYRLSRNDFRGAASILYERLQLLSSSSVAVRDPEDDSLLQTYLMLINALACVAADQAWILADPKVDDAAVATLGTKKGVKKRRVVTLEDVRREYQAELDRLSALENGRFAFAEGADGDVL